MKVRTIEYYIREVFISLRRNNWMSVASIGTVAVSLFIFGMFLMMVMNMNKLAENMESQVQINVYLLDKVDREQARDIEKDLKEIEGVESVGFVTKDEAMERFKDRLGDQKTLLDALDETNPLPDSFEVTVTNPDLVKTAAEKMEKLDGVECAKYGQDVMEHLFEITRLLRIFGFTLMLVLAFATLFIISNTIRLTVFARRKEIAIMKYVGATDWFIRWPFVMEGMVLGLFGSIIAAMVLRTAYTAMAEKVYDTLAFFPLIPEQPFLTYITIVVVISGMVVGAIGSAVSIKKFLKV
ncbi:MAG: permease-like cell division protein FtsX [Veillonellaceae bacterium]|uniref:permease-like cell division protein FtsX n=1 Tax=Anaerovibrio lipolyticus TaxID=82374 RepID=UPI001F44D9E6|nr:permease-like cell division protein FtsX [Anaerovibrio lipolyticus]MCI6911482.1 permease-like cell division protein FtsX [Veillonellaceae bacterium]MDY4486194.1 permease-like cell division protein FtsX [Anaerovibrio sp.]MCF2601846.1 ABC transporter permease [Anaerovibrio lipolyticus]MCI7078095.1 permease-like cell division protein FtsX [Veillonellaceae bacterium]MCI7235583.1 permease-like cell division protein FtsX [Veillonellaceae bacterium]